MTMKVINYVLDILCFSRHVTIGSRLTNNRVFSCCISICFQINNARTLYHSLLLNFNINL